MRNYLLLALLLTGCMTKAEVKTDAQAWRAFTDAVTPDLVKLYGAMPEPSRTTRLRVVRENEAALEGLEGRVGLREAAPVTS